MRTYGWKKDPHDARDWSHKKLFGARRAALPGEASYEGLIAEIWDQGATSSCVGQAIARAAMLRCAIQQTPIARPSAQGVYTIARAEARLLPSEKLVDEGSFPRLAMKGIQEYGVAEDREWPFDPGTINDDPDLLKLEDASAFILSGFYRVDSVGHDRALDVMQALSEGFPLVIGVSVDQAFEDASPTTIVTAPGTSLGGHMLCLVGYDQKGPNNTTRFRICNSWGPDWADHGFVWADEAWLTDKDADDIYAITVQGVKS
ncbi:MAG: C1 family peptidase [Vulcanimicrobiaceae bacterium]